MASRIPQLQVNYLLQLNKEELSAMGERINYYVNRERISECEFGDSNFLDELKRHIPYSLRIQVEKERFMSLKMPSRSAGKLSK